MQDHKLIASVAVFKHLHQEGKGIYDIINEYITYVINVRRKWTFTSGDIVTYLKDDFDFDIPEAVVRSTIKKRLQQKKIVKKEDHTYTVINISSIKSDDFKTVLKKNTEVYESVTLGIVKYIENQYGYLLDKTEKASVEDNIMQYLLGNGINEKYTRLISEYIIIHQNDEDFQQKLSIIKQGVILYGGIRYTSDVNEIGVYKEPLTIFLDMEIIFFCMGYSGSLQQQIFLDFYNLVEEINSKKKPVIYLKYFTEVKEKIDGYFYAAERAIAGDGHINTRQYAMQQILDGCECASDVIEKHSQLQVDLKRFGIEEEEYEDYYYDQALCLEDQQTEQAIEESAGKNGVIYYPDVCSLYLKLFTKINVLRGGERICALEKCKAILVTGKNQVRFMSQHIKKKKEMNFATDIIFLTDKFWFALNKGFGGVMDIPKNFSFITKAQIAIASQVNHKIEEYFDDLDKKVKEKKIAKDAVAMTNATLRKKALRPEDINSSNIEECNMFLKNEVEVRHLLDEVERYHHEAEQGKKYKKQLEDLKIKNKNLHVALEDQEKQIIEVRRELDNEAAIVEKRNLALQQRLVKLENAEIERKKLRIERYQKEGKLINKSILYVIISVHIALILCAIASIVYWASEKETTYGMLSLILAIILGAPYQLVKKYASKFSKYVEQGYLKYRISLP